MGWDRKEARAGVQKEALPPPRTEPQLVVELERHEGAPREPEISGSRPGNWGQEEELVGCGGQVLSSAVCIPMSGACRIPRCAPSAAGQRQAWGLGCGWGPETRVRNVCLGKIALARPLEPPSVHLAALACASALGGRLALFPRSGLGCCLSPQTFSETLTVTDVTSYFTENRGHQKGISSP